MSRRTSLEVSRIRAAVAAAVADLGREPIGVACSGGADSVALADAAVAVLGAARVTLVHVDHRLQPGSAAVGEAVRAFGASLGAACVVETVRVGRGASLEDQARAARYAALERIAVTHGLRAILAGHTARDQAETVLLRILRGTGPAGLAGIPPVRGIHRRPLLEISRAEIDAYVAVRGLPVLDDPMNADLRFARVRVRRTLLPALAAENPRLPEALLRLARASAEWAALVDHAAAAVVAVARREPGAVSIVAATLVAAGPAAGKRALQLLAVPAALNADHLDAAWRLATAPVGGSRGIDVPGARLERVYGDLVVRTQVASTARTLDLAGPDAPYQVRRWRPGDRMRPTRLRGRSRKLADLFVDAKVPQRVRGSARVVVRERDGEIVWAEHIGAAYRCEIAVNPGT